MKYNNCFSRGVNFTTIKYDEDLMCFFDKAHKEFKNVISELHIFSHNNYSIQEAQRIIRDWFEDNQDDINHYEKGRKVTDALSKPNAFALMVGLVSNYRQHKCWNELMKDFTNVSFEEATIRGRKVFYNAVDLSGNEIEEEGCECACGKSIHSLYTLKSTITNYKLIVGNACIEKLLIANPDLKAQLKNAKKEKDKLRGCDKCHKYKIPSNAPVSHKVCKSCWLKHREELNRECKMCGNYSIPKDSPSWKKVCVLCYRQSKNL